MEATQEPTCTGEVDVAQPTPASAITPPTKSTNGAPQQETRCRLFEISGEIRNLIYRHALVKPDDIIITGRAPGEPALLRSCKSVRIEAASIYYVENKFVLQLEDYNGAKMAPFIHQHGHYNAVGTRRKNLCITYTSTPDWRNLVEWIKAYRHGAPMRPTTTRGVLSKHDHSVTTGAWKMSDTLPAYPWSVTEHALEAMFLTLQGAYSLWNTN